MSQALGIPQWTTLRVGGVQITLPGSRREVCEALIACALNALAADAKSEEQK